MYKIIFLMCSIVSMGGAAGLFVGASLLSFIELIYFFTVRIYGTMWLSKRKKTENRTVQVGYI